MPRILKDLATDSLMNDPRIRKIEKIFNDLVECTCIGIREINKLKKGSCLDEMQLSDVLISTISNILVHATVSIKNNLNNIDAEIKCFELLTRQIFDTSKELFLMHLNKHRNDETNIQ